MTQKNRLVLLVPCAQGGTALVGGPWASGTPGGNLYENAIDQANLAIVAAQLIHPQSRFRGVAWIQGESDGDSSVSQSNYTNALTALIAGFRARITGAANSLFVIGSMVPEAISTRTGYPAIDAAHQAVASSVVGCAFAAGLSGHTSDNLHYNVIPSSRIMGARMARAVLVAEASNTGTVTKLTSFAWNLHQTITKTTSFGWNLGLAQVTKLTSFGWDVQASAQAYTFESDTVGQAPANITVTAGTFVVQNTGGSPLTGKYLRQTSGNFSIFALDNYAPASANQTLTWRRVNGDGARDGFILRPQSDTPNGNFGGAKNGYLFQCSGDDGQLKIYMITPSTYSLIANGNCNFTTNTYFRASVIGTTLNFEYSADGTSWTSIGAITDSSHSTTSGALQYAIGYGGTPVNTTYLDDISLS